MVLLYIFIALVNQYDQQVYMAQLCPVKKNKAKKDKNIQIKGGVTEIKQN